MGEWGWPLFWLVVLIVVYYGGRQLMMILADGLGRHLVKLPLPGHHYRLMFNNRCTNCQQDSEDSAGNRVRRLIRVGVENFNPDVKTIDSFRIRLMNFRPSILQVPGIIRECCQEPSPHPHVFNLHPTIDQYGVVHHTHFELVEQHGLGQPLILGLSTGGEEIHADARQIFEGTLECAGRGVTTTSQDFILLPDADGWLTLQWGKLNA